MVRRDITMRILPAMCMLFISLCFQVNANPNKQGDRRVSIDANNTTIKDILHQIKDQTGVAFFYNTNHVDDNMRISVNVRDMRIDDLMKEIFRTRGISWSYNDDVVTLQTSLSEQGKKRVTFVADNITLKDVFKIIQRQTGLEFYYNVAIVNTNDKVTLTVKDRPLDEVLGNILTARGLGWQYYDKIIRIKAVAVNADKDSSIASIQVTGKVTDAAGNPIPGATIIVKGTTGGTTADANGKFFLPSVSTNKLLIVRSVGYQEIEVPAARKTIHVILTLDIGQLDETVIKGYYNTTKALNTGNVSTVKGEDLARQPIADPIAALAGRVAGLNIFQSSGVPGSTVNVMLRGQNSLRIDANSPLYIVDGVPFPSSSLSSSYTWGAAQNISPFSTIRMSDIESIEVLKDADATSIYGSRGANGVILITTRKGKSGRSELNINIYTGVGKIARKLDLLDTEQYLRMRHEAMVNDGVTPSARDYDLNGAWDTTRYTDWQKVMIGGTAKVTDVQASLSGGSTLTQFLISGGYRKESTVFPGNNNVQKGSTHLSINHQSDDARLKVGLLASYLNDNNNVPQTDLTDFILLAPNAPQIYNEDGSLNWQNSTWTNPFAILQRTARSISNTLNSSINLSYEIVKNFNIRTRAGYNDLKLESSNINPLSALNPANDPTSASRIHTHSNSNLKSWIIEPSIDYSRKWGKNRIDALLGTTLQQTDQHTQVEQATGFTSDALIGNLSAATSAQVLVDMLTRYRYASVYTRVGYNFDEKYVLNLTGRSDASSRFGPGKQIGNFASIGTAWIFSRESFIRNNLSFLSLGKLRISYGTTGNDQIGDYQYLSTYTPDNKTYQSVPGLLPTQLTNPDFSWETVKKLEVGMELGFFNSRILFNTSWYRNQTSNQLVQYSLPLITGFNGIQANLPAVIQNTGVEFEIYSTNIESRSLNWQTSFNLTIPRNRLVAYPNIEGSSYATTYVVGQPLTIKFLYENTGIDPRTQIYTFEDVNKDGKITSAGDRKPFFIGQDYYGGINNRLIYKNFQLEFLFQFVKQNGNSLNDVTPGNFLSSGSNLMTFTISRRNNLEIQKYTATTNSDARRAFLLYRQSNGVIGDASFIRLKNISIAWNLPAAAAEAVKLKSARLFFIAQNLLTITNYKGNDPELQAGATQLKLPPIRMISCGLNLNL